VSESAESNRLFRALLSGLQDGKTAIVWNPRPYYEGEGTAFLNGVAFRVRGLDVYGGKIAVSLVRQPEPYVPLSCSSPIANWQFRKIVRASYQQFLARTSLPRRDADQKVINEALKKVLTDGKGLQ